MVNRCIDGGIRLGFWAASSVKDHASHASTFSPCNYFAENAKRFLGGLVVKAQRLLYHSARDLRVIKEM